VRFQRDIESFLLERLRVYGAGTGRGIGCSRPGYFPISLENIERTRRGTESNPLWGRAQVSGGGLNVSVSKQDLNRWPSRAGFPACASPSMTALGIPARRTAALPATRMDLRSKGPTVNCPSDFNALCRCVRH
jgi:hypothetical protein